MTHSNNIASESFQLRLPKSPFEEHLSRTWYKNSQKLRNFQKTWPPQSFDYTKPPKLRGTVLFDERVWSIPSLVAPNKVVVGCWDNAIHCVDLTTLTRVWRFETKGPVYSSPAVCSDGTFVLGAEDGVLRRIDATGRCLWSFGADGPFHATPTVNSTHDIVYAGSYDHHMYAVRLSTGELIWKQGFKLDVVDDIYSSPALSFDGSIIFGTDNELVCFSAVGRLVWSVESGSRFEGTAALNYETGTGVIGTETEGLIVLFELASGKILHSIETDGFVVSCPSIGLNGVASVGSNDGRVFGIDMHTGATRWATYIGREFRYTPFTTAPSGHTIFVNVDEKVHCVDPDDGTEHWTLVVEGGAHSSPLLTQDGYLVVGSHRSRVHFYFWEDARHA